MVYGLLYRMTGEPSEAEDLALEAFLRLYQRLPVLAPGSNLGGWLYRVATNLGLHSIRSFKRRQNYEQAANGQVDPATPDNPAELAASREEQALARRALARMSERQAELLILRYSGKSYKEIADALGLAPTSIGPLLLRAEREFEKIYTQLEREDV